MRDESRKPLSRGVGKVTTKFSHFLCTLSQYQALVALLYVLSFHCYRDTWTLHKLAKKAWEGRFSLLELHQNWGSTLIGPHRIFNQFSLAPIMVQRLHWLQRNWGQWELVKYSVQTNESASPILVQDWSSGFKRIQLEMTLSAPEYWLEWTKNYFRCQFNHVGELIHKETWSAASFGWAEGLQRINPPIYRLTTAVSDIDQTNINRDIRDGNWLSNRGGKSGGEWWRFLTVTAMMVWVLVYGSCIEVANLGVSGDAFWQLL